MSKTAHSGQFQIETTTPAGHELSIEPYRSPAFESLVEMYDHFGGTERERGLPPLDAPDVRAWLDEVLGSPSLIARCRGQVVGHVLFVRDEDGGHELGVFVRPDFRGDELKSTLVRAGLDYADATDVTAVWLTSGPDDVDSRELYADLGFSADRLDRSFDVLWMSRDD